MLNGAVVSMLTMVISSTVPLLASTPECFDNAMCRLYRVLLSKYDKDIRPSMGLHMPVNISFAFSLSHILDVDERNQILTSNAWIHQSWRDFRLIWDPNDFDGIEKLNVPHSQLWLPDVILYNSAASDYSKSIMSTDLSVTYDGNVSWTMAGIFRSSCSLDVRFYPFDVQTCTLRFASWTYDGTKIEMLLPFESSEGDQSNYMTSTEWQLHVIRAERNSVVYSCCPEPYPFIDVKITIQRRPMFFVFNLILPCILISAVALLSFCMPSGSGERVTLGITSLLSTTVFLMLLAEGMPPSESSEALPLIGIYYGVTLTLVSLATAMAVLTLNVHHQGLHGNNVPKIIQRVAFNYVAKVLMLQIDQYHSINDHLEYFNPKSYHELRTPSTSSPCNNKSSDEDASLPNSGPHIFSAMACRSNEVHHRHHSPPSQRPGKVIKRSGFSLSVSSSVKKRVSFSDESLLSAVSMPYLHGPWSKKSVPAYRRSPTPATRKTGILPVGGRASAPIGVSSVKNISTPISDVVSLADTEILLQSHRQPMNSHSAGQLDDWDGGRRCGDGRRGAPSSVFASPRELSPVMGPMDRFEMEFLHLIGKVHATIERNEMRMMEMDRREAMKLEWQQVAFVLDRFFLLVFVIATALTSTTIIYQRSLSEQ